MTSTSPPRKRRKSPASPPLAPFTWDKFSLYEICAQNPPRDVRLLRAIHADGQATRAARERASLILGEDFCGTAALSKAWCDLLPRGRAVAVDRDGPTLARAREMGRESPRLRLIQADVHRIREKADLIAVLNFSICELHDRGALVKYLRHALSRLRPGGCLICDLYGGSDAFETGLLDQRIRPPQHIQNPRGNAGAKGATRQQPGSPHPARRDQITYSWEQRSANPLTGRVVNAMHFEVMSPRTPKPFGLINAFLYDWRLWSVPELREAMREAGFTSTQVYPREAGAIDADGNLYARLIEDPTELDESFNVFIAGRR
jgi:SAM-dependent methyltransferase